MVHKKKKGGIMDFDYTDMDREEILNFVFHPRQEIMISNKASEATNIMVPVSDGIAVHGLWFRPLHDRPE